MSFHAPGHLSWYHNRQAYPSPLSGKPPHLISSDCLLSCCLWGEFLSDFDFFFFFFLVWLLLLHSNDFIYISTSSPFLNQNFKKNLKRIMYHYFSIEQEMFLKWYINQVCIHWIHILCLLGTSLSKNLVRNLWCPKMIISANPHL